MSKEFLLNNKHKDFEEHKYSTSSGHGKIDFKVIRKSDETTFEVSRIRQFRNNQKIHKEDTFEISVYHHSMSNKDFVVYLSREDLKYLQHTINRYFEECD